MPAVEHPREEIKLPEDLLRHRAKLEKRDKLRSLFLRRYRPSPLNVGPKLIFGLDILKALATLFLVYGVFLISASAVKVGAVISAVILVVPAAKDLLKSFSEAFVDKTSDLKRLRKIEANFLVCLFNEVLDAESIAKSISACFKDAFELREAPHVAIFSVAATVESDSVSIDIERVGYFALPAAHQAAYDMAYCLCGDSPVARCAFSKEAAFVDVVPNIELERMRQSGRFPCDKGPTKGSSVTFPIISLPQGGNREAVHGVSFVVDVLSNDPYDFREEYVDMYKSILSLFGYTLLSQRRELGTGADNLGS